MSKLSKDVFPVSVKVNNPDAFLHNHVDLELIYVLRGSAQLLVANTYYPLRENDLRIINAGNIHLLTHGSDDFQYISLYISTSFFNKLIPNIEMTFFECIPEKAPGGSVENHSDILTTMFWNIAKEFFPEYSTVSGNGRQDYIIEQAVLLLTEMRSRFTIGNPFTDKKLELNKDERIWLIADYIYDHYSEKILLSDVANNVFLTPNYLSHYIKNLTGATFQDLVGFIRSEMALQMLTSTDKSISAISDECGFSEPKYFTKYFKQFYNISPRSYREKYGVSKKSLSLTSIKDKTPDMLDETTKALIESNIRKYCHQSYNQRLLPSSFTMDFDESDSICKEKIPVCLHLDNAYELYSPKVQKLLEKTVSEFGIEYLYLDNTSGLSTDSRHVLNEIAALCNCCLFTELNPAMQHFSLYQTSTAKYTGLYFSSELKTTAYYHLQLQSLIDDTVLQEQPAYLIAGNASKSQVLLHNEKSTKQEVTVGYRNLHKAEYFKTVFTLYHEAVDGNPDDVDKISDYFKKQNLHLITDVNKPAVSCDIVNVISKDHYVIVDVPAKSTVLLLMHRSDVQSDYASKCLT